MHHEGRGRWGYSTGCTYWLLRASVSGCEHRRGCTCCLLGLAIWVKGGEAAAVSTARLLYRGRCVILCVCGPCKSYIEILVGQYRDSSHLAHLGSCSSVHHARASRHDHLENSGWWSGAVQHAASTDRCCLHTNGVAGRKRARDRHDVLRQTGG